MIKIIDEECLTEKEAAARYGYSQSWFARQREDNCGPKYYQIGKKCKVLYPLKETDIWFKKKLEEKE